MKMKIVPTWKEQKMTNFRLKKMIKMRLKKMIKMRLKKMIKLNQNQAFMGQFLKIKISSMIENL